MANKYLDNNGLLYLWQKITNLFVKKDGDKVLSTNDYTTADKEKLQGLENYVLPTASATEKGGIIVIHDYFSDGYDGVNAAVAEFIKSERKVIPFPIGDSVSIAIQKE